MKFSKVFGAMIAASAMITLSAHADVNLSGFASINAGKVLSGDGVEQFGVPPTFLADYPIVSAYEEEWSFEPESLFGLQVGANLGSGLTATAQIVARGANDWDPEFEWAYLSYDINDSWTVQAGKKRLPLFYYSDFYDVGYAYVWMRAPADNYTWQIFNYNGVNVLYSTEVGDWSLRTNLYAGREDDTDNKLLGDFFFGGAQTREIWKDIVGGVVNLSKDEIEIRLTAMQYTNERYIEGERQFWDGKDYRDGTFYGAAFNYDAGDWFVLTEISRLDLDDYFDTRMVTFGYRFNEFTPFVGYSEFEQDADGGEDHNTLALGLRWDFHSSAAFKVQYDRVKDNSFDLAVAGDSKSLTFGIDLVF